MIVTPGADGRRAPRRCSGEDRAPDRARAAVSGTDQGRRDPGDTGGGLCPLSAANSSTGVPLGQAMRAEVAGGSLRSRPQRRDARAGGRARRRGPGAATVYVRTKGKACDEAGMHSRDRSACRPTPPRPSCSRSSTGSTPIPGSTASWSSCRCPSTSTPSRVLRRIDPAQGRGRLPPGERRQAARSATRRRSGPPRRPACSRCCSAVGIETTGAHAVIVGRTNIVGKPMAAC